jgi:hypothetical protein
MEHIKSAEVQEARRLVDELSEVFESLTEGEGTFINELDDKFTRFGDATHISYAQMEWLRRIYERVL